MEYNGVFFYTILFLIDQFLRIIVDLLPWLCVQWCKIQFFTAFIGNSRHNLS